MLTKESAKGLIRIKQITNYTENDLIADWDQVESVIDTIYNSFEQRLCDNCTFDYCGCSVQDSILQVNPEATFTTFGCNSFESKPCK